MKKLITFFKILKKAAEEFVQDNAFKLSASLSYYTIFALGPVLLIIISLVGIFLGKDAAENRIYAQINGLVGNNAAFQVQEIIKNTQQSRHSVAGVIIGIIILLIGATGVFTEIQGSVNYIWSIRTKPKKSWLKLLLDRLLSFSLLIGITFILMISLVINSLIDLLNAPLKKYFVDFDIYIFYALNLLMILLITTLLFAVIFKVLPDAVIKWKDALTGAFFTAVLFVLGKFLIGFYLGSSNINLMYGAAASIVIILAWVYYSSIILYFGAEFTKAFIQVHRGGIRPNDRAVLIVKQEVVEINKPEEGTGGS